MSTTDFRRYFRPFFIDPLSQNPTSLKPYYDFFSYLVTQLAFSFATTPFLVLGFSDSIKVWGRVYFYTILGVAASIAFFASPAKLYLKNQIEERQAKAGVQLRRSISSDSLHGKEPLVGPGLSSDATKDIDEMVAEARQAAAVQWAKKNKQT